MDRQLVAKLTNDNYDAWKLEVKFVLIRDGLWKFVVPGVKPVLSEDSSNAAELVAWDEGDQRAQASMGLLITRSQYGFIRNVKTAKQFWDALQKQHEKKSLTSKLQLLKKLCDLKYHAGDDIEEFLLQFEDMFEKLALAGTTIDNELQVIMVFRSLPSSFDALTTNLENRSEAALTLDLVKSKIINEVLKQQNAEVEDSMALKTYAKKKIICHHCSKPGHTWRKCELLQQEENQQRNGEQSSRSGVNKKRFAKAKVVQPGSETFAFGVSEKAVKQWVVDSGASAHMSANSESFEVIRKPLPSTPRTVTVANGRRVSVKGIGQCRFSCYGPEGQENEILLTDVLFVPDFDMNLVSVSQLVQKGAEVLFDEEGCTITRGKQVAAIAPRHEGLYYLRTVEHACAAVQPSCKPDCIHGWHRRFGHRDVEAILDLHRKQLATGIKVRKCGSNVQCECCLQNKMSRLPFPKKAERKTKQVLDLVHSDLCGPMNTVTPGGQRYFLTLIDDYSRFTTLYFLRQKSGTTEAIKDFVRQMKTQFGKPPKVIRSDQGGEYRSAELVEYLKSEGIQQQFTTAYTPQQNGVAERKNRSLVEMGRCMITDANMPYKYWAEAISTANYLQNLLPTKPIATTPYEIWHGVKPDLKMLRVFGSSAYVFIPKEKRSKLQPKSIKLTFIGYSLQHKAWKFIDTTSQKVVISRDARFLQPELEKPVSSNEEEVDLLPLQALSPSAQLEHNTNAEVVEDGSGESDGESDGTKSEQDEAEGVSDGADGESSEAEGNEMDGAVGELKSEEQKVNELEKSKSDEHFLGFDDFSNLSEYLSAEESESASEEEEVTLVQEESSSNGRRRSGRKNLGVPPERFQATSKLVKQQLSEEPMNYTEAVNSTDSECWKAAMQEELASLQEHNAWELVTLPPGKKPIGCRWIFKKKEDDQGMVVRFKARLVAQGFTQRYGLDYDEVFAPVAKQVTIRALLTIATRRGMLVKHVDVKTAYLNGDLQEVIFMKLPPGVVADSDKVCLLQKSLYGLKQSARVWNSTLNDVLKELEFEQAEADPCLYVRRQEEIQDYVLIYVDDMLIVTHSEGAYQEIVAVMSSTFKLSELGDVKHFLGVQVARTPNGFSLCQGSYIEKLLLRFCMDQAKGSRIPMDPGYVSQKEEKTPLPSNEQFQSVVGGLLYISVNTRPDIAISSSILGRQVSKPTNADWTEAKRVLRYLKATSHLRLYLGNTCAALDGYVDADWAGDVKDRKSTSGFLFRLGGGLISWSARKQSCVALSSTEAEYISLAEGCRELLWLNKLLRDFGESADAPTRVFEDNQSCIGLLKQNSGAKRSKHVDTKYHFVKQLVEDKQIEIVYCPSDKMLADILTKPLNRVKLETLRNEIGIRAALDEEE